MGTTALIGFVVLGILWLVLLALTFRAPAPHWTRLLFFQAFLLVSLLLAYVFVIRVLKINPNPYRVALASFLSKDKMVYLGDPSEGGIVPGVYDLDYIHRINADSDQEKQGATGVAALDDWLVFYKYDVIGAGSDFPQGPFGASIYETDACRPPSLFSFELVPVNYDYLAQTQIQVTGNLQDFGSDLQIRNIIPYEDPSSGGFDRPEVIIFGRTGYTRTDLNIFRKVGVQADCAKWGQWRNSAQPGAVFSPGYYYQNIGSFRGTFQVALGDSKWEPNTVYVWDSAGFERSQFTVQRVFYPEGGTYFQPGTQVLRPPSWYTLDFGPGWPDNIPQVYYPEKAVLAFYLSLTTNGNELKRAESYLSDGARDRYDVYRDQFGLALPRNDVERVLVWELCYRPDVAAEQAHQTREVLVAVVGVGPGGAVDAQNAQIVRWFVTGEPNSGALPYGCEWKLDRYETLGPGTSCSGW